MKKEFWVIAFGIVLVANLAGVLLQNEPLQHISKPFIIPLLAGYFLSQTTRWITDLKKWVVAALFFSWAGDVLLLFQEHKPVYFLAGLSAFLMAHIFYIFFFHSIRVKESIKSRAWLLLVVVIYYAVLMNILSPHLGSMKLPVRIYGIFISFMFMLAMHMLFIRNKIAARWMMMGALLFVISDSVLAINKFYQSFEAAGIIIMLTYGLAQFFIIEGAIRYITSNYKE
jgi:uncharacterized membrane protein YhhN